MTNYDRRTAIAYGDETLGDPITNHCAVAYGRTDTDTLAYCRSFDAYVQEHTGAFVLLAYRRRVPWTRSGGARDVRVEPWIRLGTLLPIRRAHAQVPTRGIGWELCRRSLDARIDADALHPHTVPTTYDPLTRTMVSDGITVDEVVAGDAAVMTWLAARGRVAHLRVPALLRAAGRLPQAMDRRILDTLEDARTELTAHIERTRATYDAMRMDIDAREQRATATDKAERAALMLYPDPRSPWIIIDP